MHVFPAFVVGPRFHEGHIERTVAPADLLETIKVAGVAAEVEVEALAADDPGSPQGAVSVAQAAPGEMLRRRGDQTEAVHLSLLPPVEFTNFIGRHAPVHDSGAHAERRDEVADLALQFKDRVVVEVIVVVVRQDHRLDRWQRVDGDGRRVPALGAVPLHGRGTFAENRIGQPEFAVELEQQAGMAQAPDALVRRGLQIRWRHFLHRDDPIRHRAVRLVEEKVEPQARPFA